MSTTISANVPFGCTDTLSRIFGFCDLKDTCYLEKVCRCFREIINRPGIYTAYFEEEGLPRVINAEKYLDDLKHLNIMRDATYVSRSMIHKFLGIMPGPIPPVRKEMIDLLRGPDPFEDGKLIRHNYGFVVVPYLIERTVDANTPLRLDQSGNLTKTLPGTAIDENNGAPLSIPLSLKNLMVLCSFPRDGKKNMPVFAARSSGEMFSRCNSCPDKVSVYFMRNRIAEQSRSMTYPNQQALVEAQRFNVTPIRERAIFDAITILSSGTCPDVGVEEPPIDNYLQYCDLNLPTYARCPETIYSAVIDRMCRPRIGGFFQGYGVRVAIADHDTVKDPNTGVVPGCPAEKV